MITLFETYISNKTRDTIKYQDVTMGKFVILDLYISDEEFTNEIISFLSTTVGVIADTNKAGGSLIVKYHNAPKNILKLAKKTVFYGVVPGVPDSNNLYVKGLQIEEILYIGDNKEELEILVQTDKYNI